MLLFLSKSSSSVKLCWLSLGYSLALFVMALQRDHVEIHLNLVCMKTLKNSPIGDFEVVKSKNLTCSTDGGEIHLNGINVELCLINFLESLEWSKVKTSPAQLVGEIQLNGINME